MEAGRRLGEVIRRLRSGQGLAQAALADSCDLSKAQMSKIEKDVGAASVSRLLRIADVLGVELRLVQPATEGLARRILEVGITDCFRSEDEAKDRIQHDIGEAENIRLLLIRGWSFIGKGSRSVLRDLIMQKKKGSVIRALILDPQSEYLEIVAGIRDLYAEELVVGIKKTITELEEIRRFSEADFSYRLYDDFPTWRLVFADDKVFVAGYSQFSEPSGDRVHYRITRKEPPSESLFLSLDLYFEHLWKRKSRPPSG
jgi:transcriptional regulator with XRE-family HTH domain